MRNYIQLHIIPDGYIMGEIYEIHTRQLKFVRKIYSAAKSALHSSRGIISDYIHDLSTTYI
jgi:hypothetical protein